MSRLPNSSRPSRRSFLRNTAIGGAAATFAPLYPALGAARDLSSTASSASPIPEVKAFELDEITISDLQDGMTSGKFTARSLVEKYTARIDELGGSVGDGPVTCQRPIVEPQPGRRGRPARGVGHDTLSSGIDGYICASCCSISRAVDGVIGKIDDRGLPPAHDLFGEEGASPREQHTHGSKVFRRYPTVFSEETPLLWR